MLNNEQQWWGDMERMGNGRGGGWIRGEEAHFLLLDPVSPYYSAKSMLSHFKPLFGLFLEMQRYRKKLENFFENYLFFPEVF